MTMDIDGHRQGHDHGGTRDNLRKRIGDTFTFTGQ